MRFVPRINSALLIMGCLVVHTISLAGQVSASASTDLVTPQTLDEVMGRLAAGGDTTYVVNFWATWCKPCVAELPHFDKLYREQRDSGVVVLLVSVDDPKELTKKVAPFVRRKAYLPQVVLLNESKPHEWIDRVDPTWSGAIPATLFFRNGRRLFRETEFTFEELRHELKEFMKGSP